ncbi:MAG TPA: hypothetical protein EYP91_04150 [Gammaproteobacteria bacterium]|nr:hypothetical protein [Gammaproteobacteria bacterium]
MKALRFYGFLILLIPAISMAETHPNVQAALDYQLPENACGAKPKSFESAGEAIGTPIQASSSSVIFEGSGAEEMSDVDGYTRKRLERKMARWKKCTKEYKSGLLEDMEELKACAQHGLTPEQANIILANLANIQQVYMAPE